MKRYSKQLYIIDKEIRKHTQRCKFTERFQIIIKFNLIKKYTSTLNVCKQVIKDYYTEKKQELT
jgi:hypothetical protein